MTISKTLLLTLGGAAVVESILWMVCVSFSTPGAGGPGFAETLFSYWHTIGFTLAEKFGPLSNLGVAVCVAISGVTQFFVILLFVIVAMRIANKGKTSEQAWN